MPAAASPNNKNRITVFYQVGDELLPLTMNLRVRKLKPPVSATPAPLFRLTFPFNPPSPFPVCRPLLYTEQPRASGAAKVGAAVISL